MQPRFVRGTKVRLVIRGWVSPTPAGIIMGDRGATYWRRWNLMWG